MECRVEFDYEAQESDELDLKKGDLITNVVTKMDGWWEGTLSATGKRGMFPDNFVKVVTSHSSSSGDEVQSSGDAVQLRKKSGTNLTHVRRLKALFSYSPEQEDELHLEVGDEVDFIAEVEEGWWRGQLKGRTGIFPSNFVTELDTPTPAATLNGNKDMSKGEYGKQNEHKNHGSINIKVPPDVVPSEKSMLTASTEEEPAPKLPPKPVRETARCFYPYPAQNDDELNLEEGDIVLIISKDCEDEGWWRGELRGKSGVFPDNFVQIISPNEPVPTSPFPSSTNSTDRQPTMTASERTSDDQSSGIAKKKELPSLVGGTNTITITDGGAKSKFSFDKAKEKEITPVKKNSFHRNSSGKESPIAGQPNAKPSPVSSTIIPNQKIEISKEKSLSIEEPIVDFNGVERGDKLVHLTANRAKAPRRRPPSTGTPKDNDSSFLNGSATNSFEDTDNNTSSPTAHSTPFNLSLKSPTTSSAINPRMSGGSDSLSLKDTSINPSPVSASAQPKAPWLAELRKNQAKKQPPVGGTSSTSISPVPSLHQPKEKDSGSNPTPPVSAARTPAPPLPVKPTLPQVSPASTIDRALAQSPTSPNPSPSLTTTIQSSTTNISSATTVVTNNLSNVASRFGGQKRTVTTINHTNAGTGNGSPGTGDAPQPNLGGSPGPEWVPYEEHAKLKEKVSKLEAEMEMMKKQLRLLSDKNFSNSTGHIV